MESIEQRANKLISQMTLDEKLAQIGSYWMFDLQTDGALDWDKTAGKLKHGIGQITRLAGASTLDPVSAAKVSNSLQKFLVEKTRLGIPVIIHEECCSGAMMLGGTMYPQMLGLASTFQPELAEAMIAVILMTGRPYALTSLAENTNAILEAWLPGEEGGSALADILFGDVNPGGKLPITFPRSVGQVPIFYNAKPAGTKSHWYVDYVSEKVSPLYPFGHGLSYTSFEYRDLVIQQNHATLGEIVDISLNVRNIGKVAGEEVVQLYVRDEFASIPRPIKELKGYQRLRLDPGETRRITFHLPVDQLAFYNMDMNLVIEAGRIDIMLGSSSEDIRLCGDFEITGEKKMVVKDRVFACPVTME